MAGLSDHEVEAIAQRIVADLTDRAPATRERPATPSLAGELGVFESIGPAVQAASVAFGEFDKMGLRKRDIIIAAIRNAMREHRDA